MTGEITLCVAIDVQPPNQRRPSTGSFHIDVWTLSRAKECRVAVRRSARSDAARDFPLRSASEVASRWKSKAASPNNLAQLTHEDIASRHCGATWPPTLHCAATWPPALPRGLLYNGRAYDVTGPIRDGVDMTKSVIQRLQAWRPVAARSSDGAAWRRLRTYVAVHKQAPISSTRLLGQNKG